MAKINFQIDTESNEDFSWVKSKVIVTASHKPGLLSSVNLSTTLIGAFLNGFGAPGSNMYGNRSGLGYGAAGIQQGKKLLKNIDNCDVMATVGGNVAYNAIVNQNDNPPFVSLLGQLPDLSNLGNCKGGVSLNSWQSNQARINYLTTKLGCQANQIGLYYNPNSAMSANEIANWNMINPPPNGAASSAAAFSGVGNVGGAAPTNNPNAFPIDLNQGSTIFPNRVIAIIISADPFFQVNMTQLIQAANNWLQGGGGVSRYVCYPLQDYKSGGPTSGKSTCYGPDLATVFNVLGVLTQLAAQNPTVGFFSAIDQVQDL